MSARLKPNWDTCLIRECESLLRKIAKPSWIGSGRALRRLIRKFVRQNRKDSKFLHNLLLRPSQAALATALLLFAFATPVYSVTFIGQTGSSNPFNGVDAGSTSAPTFVDIDGDGDQDAFVGEYGGTILYYQNTGSSTAASFSNITGASNPFNGVDVGERSVPTFVDIDGDGDQDAFIGEGAGNINYFENTGNSTNPTFSEVTGASNPFNGVDIGGRASPTFVDIDGDGDQDAFIGETAGSIKYYQNTGNSTNPTFSEVTGSSNPFNGVDLGSRVNPVFLDIDGDGDQDAFIGEGAGNINYFENTGTSASPTLTETTGSSNPFNGVDVGTRAFPTFVDIDGDGDQDAFIGEFDGNINYYIPLSNVTLSSTYNSFGEDGEFATVTATLDSTTSSVVIINLSYSGLATSNTDYSLSSTNMTISAGSLASTIYITNVGDTIYEGAEDITVGISSLTSATTSSAQSLSFTITDAESVPTVTLSTGGSTISENSGTQTVVPTLSVATTVDVTVNVSYSGTATRNTDYSASADSATISAGSQTSTITLTATQDTTYEADETIIVDIDSVSGGGATESGTQQSTITLSEDDSAPTVSLSVSSSSVAEASGTATVTATLSIASTSDVTVGLSLSGTATTNNDYSISSDSITISAGSTTGTSTLTSTQDTSVEGDETIIVDIDSVSGGGATESGTQQSTITLSDDESGISLSISSSSLVEASGTSTVTVELNIANTSSDVVVDLSLSGTATSNNDYTISATSLTIATGTTSNTATITAIQDTSIEGDETIVIDISSVSGGDVSEIGTQQSTITIVDDEFPDITLSTTYSSFAEDVGFATLTATLSQTISSEVYVDFTYSGLATSGTDYSVSLADSMTIFANTLATTLYLSAIADSIYEANETISVSMNRVTNANTSALGTFSFTLIDNESAPSVTLSTGGSTLSEDSGTQTVIPTLSVATTETVTVNLSFSGEAAKDTDYTVSATTVSISAGSTSNTITITAIQDTIGEGDETIIVGIDSVSGGGASESGVQQSTVTITDDEITTTTTSTTTTTLENTTTVEVVTVVTTATETTASPTTTVSSVTDFITVANDTSQTVTINDGTQVEVPSQSQTIVNEDGSVTATIIREDTQTQTVSTIASTFDPNQGSVFTSVAQDNDFVFQSANAASVIETTVAAPDTAETIVADEGTVTTTVSINSNVVATSTIEINGNATNEVRVTQTNGEVVTTSISIPPGNSTSLVPENTDNTSATNALLNIAVPQDLSITTVDDIVTEVTTDGSLQVAVHTFTDTTALTAEENTTTESTTLSLPPGTNGSMSFSGAIRTVTPQVTTPSGNELIVQTATNSAGQTEAVLEVIPAGSTESEFILLPQTGSDAAVEVVYNEDGSGAIVITTSLITLDTSRLGRAGSGRAGSGRAGFGRSRQLISQTEEAATDRFYMGRTPETNQTVHLYPMSAQTQIRIERSFDSEITTIQLMAGEADLQINHGDLKPLLDTDLIEVINTPIRQSIQEGINMMGLSVDSQLSPWDLETKFDDNVQAVWVWDANEQEWQVFSSSYPEQLHLNLEVARIFENIKPGDGLWIFASAPTELILSNEDSIDVSNQFTQLSSGWNLLSNGKTMTVHEVVDINPDIQSLWLYRDNHWFAYSPDNRIYTLMEQDESVKTISHEATINPTEAFWVEVSSIAHSSFRLKKPPAIQ